MKRKNTEFYNVNSKLLYITIIIYNKENNIKLIIL